uniref:SH2 domain-containing protein 4B n=1 Tax=Magallana gigas TaxID=29159 RepID=K1RV22_MAGGI
MANDYYEEVVCEHSNILESSQQESTILQQILQTMTVDPDLLSELSDEQTAILFVKIREEQVRRYNEFEKKNQDDRIPRKPKKGRKNVDFLLGKNGMEKQREEAELASLKQAREMARKLEEEKQKAEEEEKIRVEQLRVNIKH